MGRRERGWDRRTEEERNIGDRREGVREARKWRMLGCEVGMCVTERGNERGREKAVMG